MPQFTLNALANFVDVLRLAADDGDRSRPIRCQWEIMSHSSDAIRASCGVRVAPTSRFIEFGQIDYVAVVGGLLHQRGAIDDATRHYLLRANDAHINLLGICTGAFVLCRLGLMKERQCCVSWYHYSDFLGEFSCAVPVADEMYVVDGDRITCSGGVGAALTAAFLVERHLGASSAQKALRIMQIDRTRPGATLQPAPPLKCIGHDERVTRALLTMEQNICSPVSVSDIAQRVHISTRHLERIFNREMGMGPLAVYLRLRVMHAELKLKSGASLLLVASETGFAGVSQLTSAFMRTQGYGPNTMSVRRS
jgi:transcriptional regulator GlxA family with amidase domain